MDHEVFSLCSGKVHDFGHIVGNTAFRPFRLHPLHPSSQEGAPIANRFEHPNGALGNGKAQRIDPFSVCALQFLSHLQR